MKKQVRNVLSLMLVVAVWAGCAPTKDPSSIGALGAAIRNWQLPDTPGGLTPVESWHATGSAPDGSIYIGGMDHATNSALYRLESRAGTLRYVGDARSASEAAHNWLPGETAEKFHTRPLWYRGQVYVASLDRSGFDDAYLSRRGFHWYVYDPDRDRFADVSIAEPGGTGAALGGLVTLAADPVRNVVYGASVPTGDIFRYDVARRRTEDLGRPTAYDKPYLYTGRVIWVDSRGRLYFTAGNPSWGTYEPAIYAHVYYHDPADGFGERRDWTLREPRALEIGQCTPDRKRCFFADDHGHVYRFDDSGPTWTYVGQAAVSSVEVYLWAFDVSADGRSAYLIGSTRLEDASPSSLYEFDLTTGITRRLCGLADLDPNIAAFRFHTGYGAWDDTGGFYFASFTPGSGRNVIATRVDPVRLKAALKLLPEVIEVSVDRAADGSGPPSFAFARTGDTRAPQEVLYKLTGEGSGRDPSEGYGRIVIPAAAASATVPLTRLRASNFGSGVISVIPNGNDYVVGANRSVVF
jgi:hypothetical protein